MTDTLLRIRYKSLSQVEADLADIEASCGLARHILACVAHANADEAMDEVRSVMEAAAVACIVTG